MTHVPIEAKSPTLASALASLLMDATIMNPGALRLPRTSRKRAHNRHATPTKMDRLGAIAFKGEETLPTRERNPNRKTHSRFGIGSARGLIRGMRH